jgi:hypothetical protein
MVVHIQHQVLAHHRQSNQSDIAIRFRHVALPLLCWPVCAGKSSRKQVFPPTIV